MRSVMTGSRSAIIPRRSLRVCWHAGVDEEPLAGDRDFNTEEIRMSVPRIGIGTAGAAIENDGVVLAAQPNVSGFRQRDPAVRRRRCKFGRRWSLAEPRVVEQAYVAVRMGHDAKGRLH